MIPPAIEAACARCIDRWERRLAGKYSERSPRKAEWGLEWWAKATDTEDGARQLEQLAEQALADSDKFFSYRVPEEFHLNGRVLSFTSPVVTPCPENNRVHAKLFKARQDNGRAVLVLPQWNSSKNDLDNLCRLLSFCGMTVLRMTLAYHEPRTPTGHDLTEYTVSSNLGRTLHAARQSVIDARACLDWLHLQGYHRLGVLGTSLGSCVAFLVMVHDRRIKTGVLHHVSTSFADVVWTGLPTRYVRESLAQITTQDGLRRLWAPIGTTAYMDRLLDRDVKLQVVWARWDTTFLPEYSLELLGQFRNLKRPCEERSLPCGHFTSGRFPFNLMGGLMMCRFLSRHL